jgi:hypothetical protein
LVKHRDNFTLTKENFAFFITRFQRSPVKVADAHAHVHSLISVLKMVTVLEECITENQHSVMRYLWAKGLNAKDIYKEMFSVYGGKCLSCKTVHNWVKKFSQGLSKVADDARPGSEVTEKTVKRLLRCGFRRTGKAMGQVYQCWWRICREINVYQCWWRICREINVYPGFEYHTFCFVPNFCPVY